VELAQQFVERGCDFGRPGSMLRCEDAQHPTAPAEGTPQLVLRSPEAEGGRASLPKNGRDALLRVRRMRLEHSTLPFHRRDAPHTHPPSSPFQAAGGGSTYLPTRGVMYDPTLQLVRTGR